MTTGPTRTPEPAPIESLLAERAWMQGLARGLLADEADDVVQDAWLASVRSPPRAGRGLRAWLGTVVRNKAWDRLRARRTRELHERAAPARTSAPATAGVVVQAEVQQQVAHAVMALDEPYRTTVLLRFFEGLTPSAAAERLGVPTETVRTRTRRALDRLRQNLDSAAGGREQWTLAMLPLCGDPLPASPLPGPPDLQPGSTTAAAISQGALLMSAKTKMLAAGLLLTGLGAAVGWLGRDAAAGESVPVTALQEEQQRTTSTETERDGIAADLAQAERALASEREQRLALDERVAALETELENVREELAAAQEAAVSPPGDDEPRAAIEPDAYDGLLSKIEWANVGKNTLALLGLMDPLVDAMAKGEQLDPAVMGEIARTNAPLTQAAMTVTGKLPGAGINGSYANPVFISNLMHATLGATDTPLNAEQTRALATAVRDHLARAKELQQSQSEDALALRLLLDDIELREKFSEAALGMMSADQRQTLRPTKTAGRMQMDLFGSAVQWGPMLQRVRHDGSREDLARKMYGKFEIDVQAGADHAEAIQRIMDEWAAQLPQEVLEIRGDGLERMGYGQGADVLLGARHTIVLFETIARDVPLSPEARKRLKDINRPFVPYRK